MTDTTPGTPHAGDELLRVAEAVHAGEVSVAFRSGPTVLAKVGDKLLDIAEASQVPIESGCRMGMCGSDPVRVLEGEENLSPMRSAERRTQDRLALGAGCRMACVARVQGPVVVDPHPGLEAPSEHDEQPRLQVVVDDGLRRAIQRVVVIGAGVAGVTAAEELRRALPDAELTLVGDEAYAFVIATGARPLVPPIDGFGAEGSFVLRTIDDEVQIQQHIRRWRCRTAVIVGAGLLGLEAAYNVAQLDVRVLVLDRGPWPLSRQLDEQARALLWEMLQDLGIELVLTAEAKRILGDDRVRGVELIEGRSIDAELCLVATGIQPNSELAVAAGLDVAVGITVDDGMHTSDPHIFAVGDVVDHGGRRYGLWPASVEQAQVAATKMVGGDAVFHAATPPARLKVPGIDLLSVGVVDAHGADTRSVAVAAYGARRYRKLILENGRLAGAIVLGSPELFDDVTRAVEARLDLGSDLDALEHGQWQALPGPSTVRHSRANGSYEKGAAAMAIDVETLEESFDLVAPQGDALMRKVLRRPVRGCAVRAAAVCGRRHGSAAAGAPQHAGSPARVAARPRRHRP